MGMKIDDTYNGHATEDLLKVKGLGNQRVEISQETDWMITIHNIRKSSSLLNPENFGRDFLVYTEDLGRRFVYRLEELKNYFSRGKENG